MSPLNDRIDRRSLLAAGGSMALISMMPLVVEPAYAQEAQLGNLAVNLFAKWGRTLVTTLGAGLLTGAAYDVVKGHLTDVGFDPATWGRSLPPSFPAPSPTTPSPLPLSTPVPTPQPPSTQLQPIEFRHPLIGSTYVLGVGSTDGTDVRTLIINPNLYASALSQQTLVSTVVRSRKPLLRYRLLDYTFQFPQFNRSLPNDLTAIALDQPVSFSPLLDGPTTNAVDAAINSWSVQDVSAADALLPIVTWQDVEVVSSFAQSYSYWKIYGTVAGRVAVFYYANPFGALDSLDGLGRVIAYTNYSRVLLDATYVWSTKNI